MRHTRDVKLSKRSMSADFVMNAITMSGVDFEQVLSYQDSDDAVLTISGRAENIMNFFAIFRSA